MVLDNVPSNTSPYSTTNDPFSTSSQPATYDSFESNAQQLNSPSITSFPPTPQSCPPLAPLSSLYGYSVPIFASSTIPRARLLSQGLSRDLTNHEWNAIVDNRFRGFAGSSWVSFVSLLWAGYRIREGWNTLSLPLQGIWGKETMHYDIEKGHYFFRGKDKGYLGFRNHSQFLKTFRTVRGCSWITWCWFVGLGLGAIYDNIITTNGLSNDPRFAGVKHDLLKGQRKHNNPTSKEPGEGRPMLPVGRDPTGQGNQPLGDLWKGKPPPDQQRQRRRKPQDDDDASPTAGNRDDEDDWSAFGVGEDFTTKERPKSRFSKTPAPARSAGSRKASRSMDDEPSSSIKRAGSSAEDPTSAGESAWERIRRESSPRD